MKKRIANRALLVAALILFSLLFLTPLFFMIITALKRPDDLAAYPMHIMPPLPQWKHFRELLLTTGVINFWNALGNSLMLTVVQTAIVALSSALAGYGFARFRARGKNFFFTILLATLMLPQLVMMIPQFIIFTQLGLVGLPRPLSFLPLWLPSIGGWGFFIFLYRQFFATLPKELEDAAMIDGCGRLRTFWQIFMPMAGPAITTTCILVFQWTYTDFGAPILYLSQNAQVLAVEMVTHIRIPNASTMQTWLTLPNIPYQMTVGIMYCVPMIILFAFAQRYFLQTLVTSGLKS